MSSISGIVINAINTYNINISNMKKSKENKFIYY